MTHTKTTDDLLIEYREAAAGTGMPDPKKSNKNADKLHMCYKQLREREEGRAGIIGLITDDNPHVRIWAAAHSLQWVPKIARPALEAMRDSKTTCAFDAEWTLKEYEEGSLSFDY